MSIAGMPLVVIVWLLAFAGGPTAAQSVAVFEESRVVVISGEGDEHVFRVELAQTDEQHAQGLMYRSSLARDAGMLFLYDPPRPVVMWMANTEIPLDMLFVDQEGIIRFIHKRAVPHSRERIPSRGKVAAVLEVNGGTVDRLGIRPGNRLRHAFFER